MAVFCYGVDIVAHQLAMENNLQTIGVFGPWVKPIETHKKYVAK
jgi:DNA processing protein